MVIWTPQARADLKAIHDYITLHSPRNAKQVIRDIISKTADLAELPRMGKVIPEVAHDNLREIGVHTWRILYHLRQDSIHVLTIVHKRRLLNPGDISSNPA